MRIPIYINRQALLQRLDDARRALEYPQRFDPTVSETATEIHLKELVRTLEAIMAAIQQTTKTREML